MERLQPAWIKRLCCVLTPFHTKQDVPAACRCTYFSLSQMKNSWLNYHKNCKEKHCIQNAPSPISKVISQLTPCSSLFTEVRLLRGCLGNKSKPTWHYWHYLCSWWWPELRDRVNSSSDNSVKSKGQQSYDPEGSVWVTRPPVGLHIHQPHSQPERCYEWRVFW